MTKSLINHAIAVLEATVPELKIGFRLVVYYPPKNDYRLSTVSNINDDNIKVLFDTGELVLYSTNSKNIIGKGIPDLHEKPLLEEGLKEYIKSFYVKPSLKMLQKVKPTSEEENYQKQLNPIYEVLTKCSSRLSNSNQDIPYIHKNKLGGEIKKEISIDSLIARLKKIDKIIIHEPSKKSNFYLISDPYRGKQIAILPPNIEYSWIIWYYI